MGMEGVQEFFQTMGETLNSQYGTTKYGDDLIKLATDKDTMIEALTAAGMGVGGSAHFKALGAPALAKTVMGELEGSFSTTRGAPTTQKGNTAQFYGSMSDFEATNDPKAVKANNEIISRETINIMHDTEQLRAYAEIAGVEDPKFVIPTLIADSVEKLAALNNVKSAEGKAT